MRMTLPALLLAVCCCSLGSQPADAQSCTFSISSIDFGSIDVTSNAVFTATATYSATCSALASATRTCPSIGAGTGGSSSGSPRYLVSGGSQLSFNLYSDAGYASVWGSQFWGFSATPPAVDITTVVIGNGSVTRTIYARIGGGQQSLPAGTYSSSFAGANTRITYGAYALGLYPPDCASLSTPFGTAAFNVTATVVPSCSVSATPLNFGSVGVLSSNVDSANTLQVTCTAQTPYAIGLGGGLSGATNPAQRIMVKGSETVTYGLYADAARAQPWGNSIGINTTSAVGTGSAQSFTVYGRASPQTTPSPGLYSDTIVVTVTY